jgi:diguanylate cyclase (GGDEF)-like protein
MTDPTPQPQTPRRTTLAQIRPWIARSFLAGMLAVGAAVLAMRTPWENSGIPIPREIFAILAGWVMLMATLPWSRMYRLARFQVDLMAFTASLRNLRPDERSASVRALPTDRDDELGDVARAVHDVLAEAIARRIESKNIQRSMDHSIRRETQRATAHLQREASTDPLTGLGNRRCLEQFWEGIISEKGRALRSGAVIVIDLNGFKSINDILGHDVGDDVLRFVGRLIQSSLRHHDVAVRLGGDEFVIALPDHPEHDAVIAMRRLEELFRQMPWPHQKVPRPTFSFGAASFHRGELVSGETILKRADAAMYVQKGALRKPPGSAAA